MGSNPIQVAIFFLSIAFLLGRTNAFVAQLVEQRTENPRVVGSIPTEGTMCGFSSSGRAPPCQGGGSEFEPRRPLQKITPRHRRGVIFFAMETGFSNSLPPPMREAHFDLR